MRSYIAVAALGSCFVGCAGALRVNEHTVAPVIHRLPPVTDEIDPSIQRDGVEAAEFLASEPPNILPVARHESFPQDTLGNRLFAPPSFTPEPPHSDRSTAPGLLGNIWSDHQNFYSRQGLLRLGTGIGVAAALANTGMDDNFHGFFQKNLRNARSDEYSELIGEAKFFGEGQYIIPAYSVVAVAGRVFDEAPVLPEVGEWGERSLRSILVGAPPLLALQRLTGSARPGESMRHSGWDPLDDDNGVSGHSFMGAVPLLVAAQMTDAVGPKTALYMASTLPGLSRINDNDHYLSQVALGWWLAYLATSSTDSTQLPCHGLTISPVPMPNGLGVGVTFER